MNVRRCLRQVGRILLAGLLLAGLSTSTAASVAADCQGPEPSFRDWAVSATRVFIADVVTARAGGSYEAEANGASSRLTLRVVHVLQGKVDPVVELRDVPTRFCSGDAIVGRVGDRLAIALDTDVNGFRGGNVEAWIRGEPAYPWSERTTSAAAHRLLGLAPPDTATDPGPTASSRPWVGPLFAGAAIAGAFGGAWWMRRARGRSPS